MTELARSESRESTESATSSEKRGRRRLSWLGSKLKPATSERNGRPRSPFSWSRSRSPSAERESAPAEAQSRETSEDEAEDVVVQHAFEEEGTDSEDEEALDPEVATNTEANSGKTVDEILDELGPTHDVSLPNMIRRAFSSITSQTRPKGQRRPTNSLPLLDLRCDKPVFERNRCTVVIQHGDQADAARQAKRTRSYFVATDLSEESQYAIEWTIGTVLRDGDECFIVSVMETDSKLDPEEGSNPSSAEKKAKIANQRERQDTVLVMQRIVTSLLERTRLHVKISCQSIHAKNARHMLVDLIDWQSPTMVIVGSRGLGKLKGMLLGSVSHYLVQKSSVPVMVARKRLRRETKQHKRKAELDREPRVASLGDAIIEKESHGAPASPTKTLDEERETPGFSAFPPGSEAAPRISVDSEDGSRVSLDSDATHRPSIEEKVDELSVRVEEAKVG